jgi:hypothetical protein
MENNQEQFTQIPNSLMSNKNLTDQDKLTLGLILSWIRNNKDCFMGNEYIAERLGITKNAASIRILRLEKIGCIKLNYTYKEGKKEVDKRFITLLKGIVHETKGYCPTDEEVSSKQGGIIQPLLNNELNKELHKVSHKELNNENSVEDKWIRKGKLETQLKQIFKSIPNIIKLIQLDDLETIKNKNVDIFEDNINLIEEYKSIKI